MFKHVQMNFRRIWFFAPFFSALHFLVGCVAIGLVTVVSTTTILSESWAADTAAKESSNTAESQKLLPPAAVRVVEATDAGRLTFSPLIHCRDGGTSGLWQGRSIWLFGDTVTTRPAANGLNWLSNTACFVDSHAAESVHPTENMDNIAMGNTTQTLSESASTSFAHMELSQIVWTEMAERSEVPEEWIPWTDDERTFNSLHFTSDVMEKERKRFAIWPGPLVASADDQSALVFFTNLTAGPDGPWDFRGIGRSIAVWRNFDQPPERQAILFDEKDIQLGDAACRVNDMVYAYGCQSQTLSWPMLLGRVAFDRANDRQAWEFYAGGGRWSTNADEAVSVFDGAPIASVHYNAALRCFLAVYTQPLANRLVLRTAPAPEGPWSEAVEIAPCLPTTFSIGCYAGVAHPEFSRENGLVEFVTYYRETGFFEGEIRVVEVRLAPTQPSR